MKRAIDFVLVRDGLFVNTSSDATLIDVVLDCMAAPVTAVEVDALAADAQNLGIEPLFVRDVSDDVLLES
jgi:hypothetical protein